MAAEGKPPDDESLLAQPLAQLTRLVLRYPWAVLAAAGALALVGVLLSATRLGYRTSRHDLLNPESDYNRLWTEYLDEFGEEDDAVVVVEGAGREQVVPVLEEISQALAREQRLFHAVLHEVDLRKVQAKGLHYLAPEELQGIERFLDQVVPIVEGDWSRLNLGNMAAGMHARLAAAERHSPEQAAEAERLSAGLAAALARRGQYHSPWPQMPPSFATLSELSTDYLLTQEGRLGFVLLRLAPGEASFARGSEAIDALRGEIDRISARHPEVTIGLTGVPILENDEMRASSASMLWASLLSLVGVSLLFVAGFGGVRHALLANLVLLAGMAWAFGYVTLAVGHLNILSVSFTVTLIGIGIDYGVHYVARYLQLRREGHDCPQALVLTSRRIGPAITTGALTTAVAFFAAAFTRFTGIAELGIIAGGGILLCGLAELVVLPAALAVVDQSGWGRDLPEPLPVDSWLAPLLRRPGLVLAATLTATAGVSLGLGQLWYDHNLLNMQPAGLESVELERKLLSQCNQSVWYALSIADTREELLERKARLLELDSVERTEEIVSLLPGDHEVKQPIIRRIRDRLAALPERPPLVPVDGPEELGQVLGRLQAVAGQGALGPRATRQLEQARDLLRRLPAADCYAVLSQYQQEMAGDLLSRLHVLRAMAHPEPPRLEDLPASLVDRFVGRHNRYLLKIYGRGDIWDMDALRRFVHDVRAVDPRATGNPLQAYEASLEMKQSYETAALYALVIIVGVLVLDFRKLRYALLAALPVGVGMLQMFGLLGLMDIPLNPANMIALPLIMGIAIDYGVHLVHEFRDQRGPYKMNASTAVAVLVDALTTVVGFGSLMIASHRGLQSLGRVLTIGVSCTMFTSLVMLPALLAWMTRKRAAGEDAAENRAVFKAPHRTQREERREERSAPTIGRSSSSHS